MSARFVEFQRRVLDLFLRRHLSRFSSHDLHRARVLVALLIFGFIAVMSMAVVRFMTEGATLTTVGILLGALAILGGLAHFVRTGDSGLSGDLLIITTLLIVVFTAFYDGGLYSRVLTWLPALPLIANFSSARLTAMRTTLVALVGLLFLLLAHHTHWVDRFDPNDSIYGRLGASFGSMLFVSAIAYAYEDSRRRAVGELESLDRLRSEWVSLVSHELRTPLTSLYGGLKLVAGGKLDDQPEKLKTLMTLSTRNTERLIYMVNDILDVERLTAGKVELDLQFVSLREVVEEAVRTQQYLADERGVSLSIVSAEDQPGISADYNRVLQVVQNLLSNAIKFSPKGAGVTIRLSAMADGQRCDVEDEGEGVSAEFASRLFERFSQEESGTRRLSGGSGLGLFICRSIIELHGGTIDYRPGKTCGSVFSFELPTSGPSAN